MVGAFLMRFLPTQPPCSRASLGAWFGLATDSFGGADATRGSVILQPRTADYEDGNDDGNTSPGRRCPDRGLAWMNDYFVRNSNRIVPTEQPNLYGYVIITARRGRRPLPTSPRGWSL